MHTGGAPARKHLVEGRDDLADADLQRFGRLCPLEDLVVDQGRRPFEPRLRHLLLSPWKVMVEARLPQSRRARQVGERRALEAPIAEHREEPVDNLILRRQGSRHSTLRYRQTIRYSNASYSVFQLTTTLHIHPDHAYCTPRS